MSYVDEVYQGLVTKHPHEPEFLEAIAWKESHFSPSAENGGFVPAAKQETPAEVDDGFMNIPDGIDETLPFN